MYVSCLSDSDSEDDMFDMSDGIAAGNNGQKMESQKKMKVGTTYVTKGQ